MGDMGGTNRGSVEPGRREDGQGGETRGSGRTVSRRQFVAGLGALGLVGGALRLGTRAASDLVPEASVPRYLVLIVLDAFRPDYQSLEPMPALEALKRSGISYTRAWVGQLESETPTGHATLSTGSMPKHDGIIGFEWRDPVTGRKRTDNWPHGVLAGEMNRDLREAGAPSIAAAVKAANPQARVVSLSSEKVYAANAMGGWAADYILYQARRGTSNSMTAAAMHGHLPPPHYFSHPALSGPFPTTTFPEWDHLSTMMALAALDSFRPEVLMVNLPGADVYGHPYGGPATPAVMRSVIAGLNRGLDAIVQAYRRAGLYQHTLFVVTADHGMVPNNREVHEARVQATVKHAGGNYMFHTSGTSGNIYLNEPAGAPAVAAAMARVPNVVGAYHLNPTTYTYELAAGVKLDPNLDAAYRYLLSTYAGPIAPHVAVPFRENTISATIFSAHGDHGGLNWGAQAIPLVLSGPGVPSGVVSHHPARLMDVAPTILRLLGIPHAPMDGAVLADALRSPTSQELETHARLASMLRPFQHALMQQSHDNIEEDRRTGHQPPPHLPITPTALV